MAGECKIEVKIAIICNDNVNYEKKVIIGFHSCVRKEKYTTEIM